MIGAGVRFVRWGTRTVRFTAKLPRTAFLFCFGRVPPGGRQKRGGGEGGGAGVELALGVLLFLTVGTMELDLDRCVFGVGVGSRGCQPCFGNVRRENRVASL